MEAGIGSVILTNFVYGLWGENCWKILHISDISSVFVMNIQGQHKHDFCD